MQRSGKPWTWWWSTCARHFGLLPFAEMNVFFFSSITCYLPPLVLRESITTGHMLYFSRGRNQMEGCLPCFLLFAVLDVFFRCFWLALVFPEATGRDSCIPVAKREERLRRPCPWHSIRRTNCATILSQGPSLTKPHPPHTWMLQTLPVTQPYPTTTMRLFLGGPGTPQKEASLFAKTENPKP